MKLNPQDNAGIRRYASSVIRKNRPQVMLAALIVIGVNLLLQLCLTLIGVTGTPGEPPAVTLLSNVVTLLVSAPLQYGMYELFIRLVRGEGGSAGDIFLWFSEGRRLKASLLGSLWFTLLAFCWLMLCMLPALIVLTLLPSGTTLMTYYGGLLLIYLVVLAAALVGLAQILPYMPGAFILAEDPSLPVVQSFSSACQNMKPFKRPFFRFYMVYVLQLVAVLVAITLFLAYAPLDAGLLSLLSLFLTSLASLWILPRMYMGGVCYYHAVFGLEVAAEDDSFTM